MLGWFKRGCKGLNKNGRPPLRWTDTIQKATELTFGQCKKMEKIGEHNNLRVCSMTTTSRGDYDKEKEDNCSRLELQWIACPLNVLLFGNIYC